MDGERLVTLDHSEVVRAVQRAMAEQLQRDGRLEADMELGLVFYSTTPDDMRIVGTVRRYGQTLFELTGSRAQLSAVAAQLALSKLASAERKGLEAAADVRWRTVQFADENETFDRFIVDVAFRGRVEVQ